MKLKGLILIPSRFDDPEIKFDLSSFIVNMDDNSQMELDLQVWPMQYQSVLRM